MISYNFDVLILSSLFLRGTDYEIRCAIFSFVNRLVLVAILWAVCIDISAILWVHLRTRNKFLLFIFMVIKVYCLQTLLIIYKLNDLHWSASFWFSYIIAFQKFIIKLLFIFLWASQSRFVLLADNHFIWQFESRFIFFQPIFAGNWWSLTLTNCVELVASYL